MRRRKLSFVLDADARRLTFRDRKGGQFSVPIGQERDDTPDAPPEQPKQRLTLREWLDRDARRRGAK